MSVGLTHKERFVRLFRGLPVDRAPFNMVMGIAAETLERWAEEGLAISLDPRNPESYRLARERIFGMMGFDIGRGPMLRVNAFLCPEYPEEVIEHRDGFDRVRTKWGAVKRVPAARGRMALMETPPVTDRESWEMIRDRLRPDTPGRYPSDWGRLCEVARSTDQPVYAGDLPIGFFGGPRELLGTEGLCTMFYDDPALVSEILDTLCDLWIDLYSAVYGDARFDYLFIWEDMCYKNGPLVSPALFRELLLPRYKRYISAIKGLGVPLVMVDSDGDPRKLVPLWMEAGVDITFPWETQYGLDIRSARKCYPDVGMMGGMNKSALAMGRGAVDSEIEKAEWMLRRGRFLPWLDHEVPPEVPWEAFEYFCGRLRKAVYSVVPLTAPPARPPARRSPPT